jgi:hypothetical protein
VLRVSGKLPQSLYVFDEAMRLRPDFDMARFDRLALLHLMGMEDGRPGERPVQPFWDGTPLEGRTILLDACVTGTTPGYVTTIGGRGA